MLIKESIELFQDLQKYLDNSKKGAIYFSLGSNVKGRLLNDTTKREILNAFADLPYNVLMKMDTELKDVPKNVRIEKWLPQQDILSKSSLGSIIPIQNFILQDTLMLNCLLAKEGYNLFKNLLQMEYPWWVFLSLVTKFPTFTEWLRRVMGFGWTKKKLLKIILRPPSWKS